MNCELQFYLITPGQMLLQMVLVLGSLSLSGLELERKSARRFAITETLLNAIKTLYVRDQIFGLFTVGLMPV